ncbi:unnamed protein product [Durusdinium trenchii]|uniref:Ion transport domain-containing protein n=1 Tax=Durusdinium trenchii TaxID=1381693 RepID=A0ABP0K3K1_9DINO
MAVKRHGQLSPISVLLEEFDATQNRLARENRLMEKRLAKQAKRERAQKLRKLADRARRAAEELAQSENASPGNRVVQADSPVSPSSTVFRLAHQWRHTDMRLNHIFNPHGSDELELQMGIADHSVFGLQLSFFEQLMGAVRKIRLPMNPNNTVRLVWDFLGLFLISWDVIYIPFELAFDPEEVAFTMVMGWIVLLYWTCDVLMSNLVGFYEEGELVMNQKRIICRYLRTWFFIDLIVLGPDWFLRLWGTGGDPATNDIQNNSLQEGDYEEVANALRSIRVLRVVRLLRLLKVQRLMNLVYDILDSEYVFILFTLLKLTALISVLNHVIACLWYGVGYVTREQGEKNWLDHSEGDGSSIAERSMVYQYTTALHWSLTQFTPASMDSFARNVPERIVSIVVVFFALIGFSSIVGSVTNSVAQLQALHGSSRRQFWLLRKYLNEKRIFEPTRTRLFTFLEHEVERRRKDIKTEDVRLLQLLSHPLQNLLAYELHRGPMKGHPFFGYLDQHMQPVMYRLCHKAMKFKHFASEDVCFTEAEGGKFMWVLIEGAFSYIRAGHLYELDSCGTWLSEPVLWTTWWHRGNLETASTSGQLAFVAAQAFVKCFKSHPRPWLYARTYAMKYVKKLNSIPIGRLSDIDPVEVEEVKIMAAESDELQEN